jgi:hypothetical protein
VHDPVLDAVVDHLGVVPGAHRAGVHEAELALGLERLEDRHAPLDVLGVTAHHERVAVLLAPDAAGYADVEVADAAAAEPLLADGVVVEVGVPAVDDHVAGREKGHECLDHGLGDVGRDHGPDHPGCREPLHQVGQAGGVGDVDVVVVPDHFLAGRAQALAHVAAHPTEADEAKLH